MSGKAGVCASLLALAGCAEGVEESGGPSTPDARVAEYFDAAALAIVAGAAQAEAYRLGRDVRGKEEGTTGAERLGRFEIASGPVRPDAAWLQRLRGILFDDASYVWVGDKSCRPKPGVAVRYRQGRDELHLYLCFECDMLQLGRPGAEYWADFDAGRAELVRLVKELFPDDSVIQDLEEKA